MAVLTRDTTAVQAPEFAAVGAILPDGVAVRQVAGRRASDGKRVIETIYVLLGGPKHAEAGIAMEPILEEFAAAYRTVSARLVDGIQSASRRIASENQRSLARERFRLDLALVVIRGAEALFSLAGAAHAYVVRGGQLFEVGAGDAGPALGEEDPPIPIVIRARLEQDDIILLASGEIIAYADADRIAAWFRAGVRKGARWLDAAIGNQIGVAVFEPGGAPEEQRGRISSSPVAETLRALPIEGVVAGAGGAAAALVRGVAPAVRLFVPAGDEPRRAVGAERDEASPSAPGEPRPHPQRRAAGGWRRFLAGALAAVIVVAALGLTLPTMVTKDRGEAAYVNAMTEAERSYRAALTSTDQGFARTRLREAEFAVGRALDARRDDPAALKLQEAVKAEIQKLDRVVRVGGVQQVIDLAAAGARDPSGLVVEGGTTAYVLDPSPWGVRKIALEPNKPKEPQIVAVRGTQTDGVAVGDPMAIAWLYPVDARSRVGVIVLDRDRRLFYQPANRPLVELAVRGASAWQSVQAIRGYVGNLYILDPKANQVWRYLPNWSGYDTEMRGILEGAQIADARDFSIDGNIYVLTESGKVWKFVDGIGTEFDLRSLDKPLNKPTAIVTGATARGVYVADPANHRIVVFDKEGRLQRQLVSETFSGMTALAVDEALGKFWFIAGKKLFWAPLPK
ncbi:MAG: hypothetical protein RMM58_10775 [Chloroflexota bacterium]|nr:hypothetical protein [Dehalococcoidia bacterium]MDW8254349.1 hypothetical protein [Chloroflexota bacterium]